MPTFTSGYFLDFDTEKSSIIAACCETNQFTNKLHNIIFPSHINYVSIEVFFNQLIVLKLLNELRIQNHNQNLKRKFFSTFLYENFNLIINNHKNNEIFLEDDKNNIQKYNYLKKNFLQTQNNFEIFYKEREISLAEREFYLYIFKSKQRGCTKNDLNIFTNDSKLISSISKRLFSKFFFFTPKKKKYNKKN